VTFLDVILVCVIVLDAVLICVLVGIMIIIALEKHDY